MNLEQEAEQHAKSRGFTNAMTLDKQIAWILSAYGTDWMLEQLSGLEAQHGRITPLIFAREAKATLERCLEFLRSYDGA